MDPNKVMVTFNRGTPSYNLDGGRLNVGCLNSAATCTTVSRFLLRGTHGIGALSVINKFLERAWHEELIDNIGWAYIDNFLAGLPVSALGQTFVPNDTDYAADVLREYVAQLQNGTEEFGYGSKSASMEVFFVDKLYQPIRRIPYEYEGQYGWIDSGYSLIMIRPEGSQGRFSPVVVSYDFSIELQATLRLSIWASGE
jgi:hypothetical protein